MDTSRERDQSIERLLRQSLKAPRQAGVTEACLDAETLATWVDGGLSGAALEMAQSHVADCDRCQSLVGAMVRTNAVATQPEHERATRRWLAWLVPLTATAAAVALWVAVPREANVTVAPAVASDSPPASPAAPAASPVGAATAAPAVEEPQAPQAARAKAREALSKDDRQAPAPVQELRGDTGRLEADALKEEQKSAAAAPAAAAPPAAGVVAGAVPQAARAQIAAEASADRAQSANGVFRAAPTCSPGWSAAPADVAPRLTAGSGPSAAVCWLVGRGGLVILSTDDGRTWRRLTFPEITDLSAVQAADARTATVSTADGRTFRTADAGVTWIRP